MHIDDSILLRSCKVGVRVTWFNRAFQPGRVLQAKLHAAQQNLLPSAALESPYSIPAYRM